MATRGTPLPDSLVRDAKKLLAEMSPYRVAAQLGISERTARRIKRGEHCPYRSPARQARCPGCGGMVVLPCQSCGFAVRRILQQFSTDVARRLAMPADFVAAQMQSMLKPS